MNFAVDHKIMPGRLSVFQILAANLTTDCVRRRTHVARQPAARSGRDYISIPEIEPRYEKSFKVKVPIELLAAQEAMAGCQH